MPRKRETTYSARTAGGRKAITIYVTADVVRAIDRIMTARGYTVRRDAIVWACKVAAEGIL